MKKILIVVGARPQFIKLAPLLRVIAGKAHTVIVHTGQHYDFEMSDLFFQELSLPSPDYHLEVGSHDLSQQTGLIMCRLEPVLTKEKPDLVVVTGDTNSTLAGALAAAQNRIPLAHVEAGLRCSQKWLPEQISRVVADRLSDILCCPTRKSVSNLQAEGISHGVYLTGDILYDLVRQLVLDEDRNSEILGHWGLEPGNYFLLTVHRAENVDDRSFLEWLVGCLGRFDGRVFFPVHPRTRRNLERHGLMERLLALPLVVVERPVGIIESLVLTRGATGVITDSGGLQREAAYFGKRTWLLRQETEWHELEECGAVVCAGWQWPPLGFPWELPSTPYEGYFDPAAERIAEVMLSVDLARHRGQPPS